MITIIVTAIETETETETETEKLAMGTADVVRGDPLSKCPPLSRLPLEEEEEEEEEEEAPTISTALLQICQVPTLRERALLATLSRPTPILIKEEEGEMLRSHMVQVDLMMTKTRGMSMLRMRRRRGIVCFLGGIDPSMGVPVIPAGAIPAAAAAAAAAAV